jgi:hypothetical protein
MNISSSSWTSFAPTRVVVTLS